MSLEKRIRKLEKIWFPYDGRLTLAHFFVYMRSFEPNPPPIPSLHRFRRALEDLLKRSSPRKSEQPPQNALPRPQPPQNELKKT